MKWADRDPLRPKGFGCFASVAAVAYVQASLRCRLSAALTACGRRSDAVFDLTCSFVTFEEEVTDPLEVCSGDSHDLQECLGRRAAHPPPAGRVQGEGRVLGLGAEHTELDFKTSLDLTDPEHRLGLVKDLIGMGNNATGGYVIALRRAMSLMGTTSKPPAASTPHKRCTSAVRSRLRFKLLRMSAKRTFRSVPPMPVGRPWQL